MPNSARESFGNSVTPRTLSRLRTGSAAIAVAGLFIAQGNAQFGVQPNVAKAPMLDFTTVPITSEEVAGIRSNYGMLDGDEARELIRVLTFGSSSHDFDAFHVPSAVDGAFLGVAVALDGSVVSCEVVRADQVALSASQSQQVGAPTVQSAGPAFAVLTGVSGQALRVYGIMYWHQDGASFIPVGLFAAESASQELFSWMGASCDGCLPPVCNMDAIGQTAVNMVKPLRDAADVTGIAVGIGAGLLCLGGMVLTCTTTPALPVPAGPACIASVSCILGSAGCLFTVGIANSLKSRAYYDCNCQASEGRRLGQTPAACPVPQFVDCVP